jgi:hypothetical protein
VVLPACHVAALSCLLGSELVKGLQSITSCTVLPALSRLPTLTRARLALLINMSDMHHKSATPGHNLSQRDAAGQLLCGPRSYMPGDWTGHNTA